ncbi:hypothetical protein K470DRAFT_214927 [Piedraia hortae CBS 480.64]|uniref:FHA domain-containing protein n=1 Tax=Piedraia hortae CBS 480.64 TaxID=1314780 RepID=A0A6A7C2E6_9PEZI|nr:hypothetical protein K470DRAFT_214927 [Piedraia hortae CBS 480.64]
MGSEDVGRRHGAGPRKAVQRHNSSSSVGSASSSSSGSSTSTLSAHSNGSGSWSGRRKSSRGTWHPQKSETTGTVALTPPPLNPASGSVPFQTSGQANGVLRHPTRPERPERPDRPDPPVILSLAPTNGTFERKVIKIPYYPDVIRIGRQTNQRTMPTPNNGFFDSKVLSRQHAEVWADKQGRVLIRDVKSSNGTFINGTRLSPENQESEARELRENDRLDLGIDIVSEDQRTIVHHKASATVEFAGVCSQRGSFPNIGDLDLNVPLPYQPKRSGNQGPVHNNGPGLRLPPAAMLQQQQQFRNWPKPVSAEQIMKKLSTELKLAMKQSTEMARARQSVEAALTGKSAPAGKTSKGPSKTNGPAQAPPPELPLPERPDVAQALADPLIRPLLQREDTPNSDSASKTVDHSSDILRLCEELKLARGELSQQSKRMKDLEEALVKERVAREDAEERARHAECQGSYSNHNSSSVSALAAQLEAVRCEMSETKLQMEAYRQRAEVAEAERDESRQTLAVMIDEKRKENARQSKRQSPSRLWSNRVGQVGNAVVAAAPFSTAFSTGDVLLDRAGVEKGRPITREQAHRISRLVSEEILQQSGDGESSVAYYGLPYGSAVAVLVLGALMMTYINGWPSDAR